jgi:hypothetical protein
MLKRACAALAAFFMLSAGAHAAGTVPGFSLTPQFDLSGARNAWLQALRHSSLARSRRRRIPIRIQGSQIAQPNPLTCDASGRLPQWFVADGLIKVRLTDKNGVQVFCRPTTCW